MIGIFSLILFIIAVSLSIIVIRNQLAVGMKRLIFASISNIFIIIFIGVFSPDLTPVMAVLILLLILSINLYSLWTMALWKRIIFCILVAILDFHFGFICAWVIRGFPPIN